MKNVDSLIQVDFMPIMTFDVALIACSASIFTRLKGAKIALECRTFEPDLGGGDRESTSFARPGSSKKLPRIAERKWQFEQNSGRGN